MRFPGNRIRPQYQWRLMPHSIRSRLFLLLSLPLLPLLLLQVLADTEHSRTQRQEELMTNLEVARAVAAAFEDYIGGVLRQEMAMGATLTVEHRESPTKAHTMLSIAAAGYPTVNNLYWVDPHGRVVTASDMRLAGADRSHEECFKIIAGGQDWAVGDLRPTPTPDRPSFDVARGIRDQSGALLGILVAEINPDRLGDALAVARPESGAIFIVDRKGRGIYRYPETPMTWNFREQVKTKPLIRQALANKETSGPFTSLIDGKTRLAGFVPIRSIGWVAGANRPETLVMGPARTGMFRDITLSLLVDAGAFFLALVIGISIVRPIRALQQEVQMLGQGELTHRVAVSGPVELAQLADTMDWMREALRQRMAERDRLLADLDATIASVADSLVTYSENGEILRMNPAAERLFQFTPEECQTDIRERWKKLLIKKPSGEPFPPDDIPPLRALRGEVVSGVVLVYLQQGRVYWLSCSAAPIRTPDGQIHGAVAIYTDITAQHELQEEQEAYAHTISHDLRNPLSTIQGHAQILQTMLQESQMGEKFRQSTQAILRSARRMNVMIQDLVDVARIEGGQLKLKLQQVKLADYLKNYLQRVSTTMDVGRIHIEAPDDLPPVRADYDRLERIFTNLLSNALKYSTPGTPVLVRARRVDGEVVIDITDQGPGIDPECLPHLFERFYRVKGTTSTEGIGLGLYITRTLIEAHGGRIWVESQPGVGSTFTFTLPVVISRGTTH